MVSQTYCDTYQYLRTFEKGDNIYHRNLQGKSNQTVLCFDEFGYLHPNTERYLVCKLHQMLHICLNTYGKIIVAFPKDNETLRDTEHRLHGTYLKRTMFQIVENWYSQLMHFTQTRLNEYRRHLHKVSEDYQNCSKQDIGSFWQHDASCDIFVKQLKRHLRDIIRHHFLNLEKAFYEKSDHHKMMHTHIMNATEIPYTVQYKQAFNARHLANSEETVPITETVSIHVHMISIPEKVTKGKRTTGITKPTYLTTAVSESRPLYKYILNFSPVTYTYPENPKDITENLKGKTLKRAHESKKKSDCSYSD